MTRTRDSTFGRRAFTWRAGWVLLVALAVGAASGCGEDGKGCAEDMPSGSFAASCEGCKMEGTVLSCRCSDGSALHDTELDTCSCEHDDVYNDHGSLKCGDGSCIPDGNGCARSSTPDDGCCSGYCGANGTCE